MAYLKIGVYDSGVGGVSVLKELLKEIPEGDFYYLSDSKNNPYGDKTKEQIESLVFQNIRFLIKKGCSLIVVACNTATAVAIETLRKQFPDIIFIGTEPAIKVIYDRKDQNAFTLLLATKLTLECKRVKELTSKYPIPNLISYPCSGLAELIENQKEKEIDAYFENHFSDYKNFRYLILGCTHYPLIYSKFASFFKDSVIVDGSRGISKQVKRKIQELGLSFEKKSLEFYDTSDSNEKYNIFYYYLKN